ncbi:MAG: hypothetical protein MUF37_03575, partial [Methanoregulaceae archaeon]|nr:hypothetical protein [Methanoregulaceae archaeon]
DLNPGQKLRRLLGCPLPYRDTGVIRLGSDSITSFSWLKNMCITGNSEILSLGHHRSRTLFRKKVER